MSFATYRSRFFFPWVQVPLLFGVYRSLVSFGLHRFSPPALLDLVVAAICFPSGSEEDFVRARILLLGVFCAYIRAPVLATHLLVRSHGRARAGSRFPFAARNSPVSHSIFSSIFLVAR
jgi:hypothetical protein